MNKELKEGLADIASMWIFMFLVMCFLGTLFGAFGTLLYWVLYSFGVDVS